MLKKRKKLDDPMLKDIKLKIKNKLLTLHSGT
jgi:hypothetical protein